MGCKVEFRKLGWQWVRWDVWRFGSSSPNHSAFFLMSPYIPLLHNKWIIDYLTFSVSCRVHSVLYKKESCSPSVYKLVLFLHYIRRIAKVVARFTNYLGEAYVHLNFHIFVLIFFRVSSNMDIRKVDGRIMHFWQWERKILRKKSSQQF